MSKLYKAYAKAPDGTKRVVHSIDFSNRYVEVVDYLGYDGLAEWCLEDVDIIFSEPELNDNQQTVLKWLKESCKLNGLREVIEIMGFLPTTGGKMKYKQVAYAYDDLNDDELKQVLQTLINLLEQEE
ncbi:hypothetical protein [Enterococcus faecalis]|uniref:hypothetical protein n=1 Tax=Enterococcus faecalis TaxID=1351 RepID=UPI000669430A|nr:hypothetical protein [Enterococcus faecalis]